MYIYIIYQISLKCFGAYCIIFTEKSIVTSSKLSAYCNVVTLDTKHKINLIIYSFLLTAVHKKMHGM